jgi:hypothetical protein
MLTSTRQIPAAIADAHGTQSACDDRTVDAIPIPDPFGTGGRMLSRRKALDAALKPGDMVIMDNLGSHKAYAVRRPTASHHRSAPTYIRNAGYTAI